MSTTRDDPATIPTVVLEPAAQALADALAAAGGPPLYTLSPRRPAPCSIGRRLGTWPCPRPWSSPTPSRAVLMGRSPSPSCGPWTRNGSLPAVVYTHGGGWILGNFATHERLVRELAAQTGAAFVFVNYTPSPEAHYPVAIEQVYATVKWVAKHGAELGLDGRRLAVAGESVGGNMTAAVTLLAKERGGPAIRFQALLYPVTNAAFDTETYEQFAEGPWLTRKAMQWFWDAYAPDSGTSRGADRLTAAGAWSSCAGCRRRW